MKEVTNKHGITLRVGHWYKFKTTNPNYDHTTCLVTEIIDKYAVRAMEFGARTSKWVDNAIEEIEMED